MFNKIGPWIAVMLALLFLGLMGGCANDMTLSAAAPTQYKLEPLPECTIYVMVGPTWTQLDVVWPDGSEPYERAYQHQWDAAQKVSDIESEFSCDVRWART